MQKLKHLIIYSFLLLYFNNKLNAQSTPAEYYGQNSWMPDTLGTTLLGGKLHKAWGVIKNSNVKLIRLGGLQANNDQPKGFHYLKMVDSTRAKGMEPILQVPFNSLQGWDSLNARLIVRLEHLANV